MGKAYAVITIRKLKTTKQLVDCFKHNERIYNTTNADPFKRHLNQYVKDLNGKTYVDAYNDTISEMNIIGAYNKKPRSDAVKGMEIIMRYSKEADGELDVEKWIEECEKYLRKTFNPPDQMVTYTDENGEVKTHKIDNLKYMVVHYDEGLPHIHAFVTTIDDRGHPNANYYTGGKKKMRDIQSSYGEAMRPLGLERGEYKSIATPEEPKRYYRNVTKSSRAELSDVQEGESAEQYRKRANVEFQDEKLHHLSEIVRMKQEKVQALSEQQKYFDTKHESLLAQSKLLWKLKKALGMKQLTEDDIERVANAYSEKKILDEAIEKHPDPKVKEYFSNFVQKFKKKEKKRRKNQEIS